MGFNKLIFLMVAFEFATASYFVIEDNPHQQLNISQREFSFKHRLLFETSRRNEIKRLIASGERAEGVPKTRLTVLTPIDEKTQTSEKGETREFIYDTDVPEIQGRHEGTNSSVINEVVDTELRFLLIPTTCSTPRQVTFSLMGEEKTFEVDACAVRWEYLTVRTLPSGQQARLGVTCKDCALKGVIYSAPYLNIITTSTPVTRMRRRANRRADDSQDCRRVPLNFVFKKMKGYELTVSPKSVDIGYCDGVCQPPFHSHNQHSALHYALFQRKVTQNAPCCAPYAYKDFEYLAPDKGGLITGVWHQAIVISCTCQ